jgi:ribosomal protein S27AE
MREAMEEKYTQEKISVKIRNLGYIILAYSILNFCLFIVFLFFPVFSFTCLGFPFLVFGIGSLFLYNNASYLSKEAVKDLKAEQYVKIEETALWSALVGLLIGGLIPGIIFFIILGEIKKLEQNIRSEYQCAQCGKYLVWAETYSRWYCTHCQRYY